MGPSNFPFCWQHLVGYGETTTNIGEGTAEPYNLVTLLGPKGSNYGYQYTSGSSSAYSSSTWTNKWVSGERPITTTSTYYSNTTYADYPGSYNTWALYPNKH